MPAISSPPSSADPQPESSSSSPELPPASPSSPPSPPPPANTPPRNPWIRNVSAAVSAADGAGAPLLGELSSWPPLRSSSQIHLTAAVAATSAATGIGEENPSDLPVASSPLEPSPHEDSPRHQPAPVSATPLPVSPPPIPSDNAAVATPPRPPPPPHNRRGRNQNHHYNQKPHNYRGGNNGGGSFYHNQHYNGGGNNGSFVNRGPPLAPGWNPSLGFAPMWQQQQWGILPGATAAAGPPPMHPYDVNPPPPFSFPVNHYDYQFYVGEAYAPYYCSPTFPPPPPPVPASPPPRQVTPISTGIAMAPGQVPALLTQLREQIEYYFSERNLETDEYLKRQMDSHGWVDIHLIAGFRKVEALTKDLNMIREALESSDIVELQGDGMRKKDGWARWILTDPNLGSLAAGMQNMQLAG